MNWVFSCIVDYPLIFQDLTDLSTRTSFTVVPLDIYLRRIGNHVELGKSHTLQVPPSMSNTASEIGTCPFCGSAVSAEATLIEYEVEGELRLFAECYECRDPVQPR